MRVQPKYREKEKEKLQEIAKSYKILLENRI